MILAPPTCRRPAGRVCQPSQASESHCGHDLWNSSSGSAPTSTHLLHLYGARVQTWVQPRPPAGSPEFLCHAVPPPSATAIHPPGSPAAPSGRSPGQRLALWQQSCSIQRTQQADSSPSQVPWTRPPLFPLPAASCVAATPALHHLLGPLPPGRLIQDQYHKTLQDGSALVMLPW